MEKNKIKNKSKVVCKKYDIYIGEVCNFYFLISDKIRKFKCRNCCIWTRIFYGGYRLLLNYKLRIYFKFIDFECGRL